VEFGEQTNLKAENSKVDVAASRPTEHDLLIGLPKGAGLPSARNSLPPDFLAIQTHFLLASRQEGIGKHYGHLEIQPQVNQES